MSKQWKLQALTCEPYPYRDGTSCRVCKRDIAQGDHVWSWRWDDPQRGESSVQFGCAACGWWRLDELNVAETRALADAACAVRDRTTISREAIRLLGVKWIAFANKVGRFYFHASGRPLRDLMLRSLDTGAPEGVNRLHGGVMSLTFREEAALRHPMRDRYPIAAADDAQALADACCKLWGHDREPTPGELCKRCGKVEGK
jgi:hypothetical protein